MIDLIAADDHTLWILDYKTDHPPTGDFALELPQYVAQVRAYAEIVNQAGLIGRRAMKLGLMFTADGSIRWV